MAQYDSSSIEKRWQEMWRNDAVYRFDPDSDKPVYSIDNPPRYTSGPLHLGHATGYSLIDFAARYRRMKGYNVFFPLCFDVNGTPIEVRVEKKYSLIGKLFVNGTTFNAKEIGWDIVQTYNDLVKKLGDLVKDQKDNHVSRRKKIKP